MIKITKNEKVEIGCLCNNCDNITRFSEEDDDFVANYDATYNIEFENDFIEITLCADCLKELRDAINDILEK